MNSQLVLPGILQKGPIIHQPLAVVFLSDPPQEITGRIVDSTTFCHRKLYKVASKAFKEPTWFLGKDVIVYAQRH